MTEDISSGNTSIFSNDETKGVQTKANSRNKASPRVYPQVTSVSPVDKDNLVFDTRTRSTDNLVLDYKTSKGQTPPWSNSKRTPSTQTPNKGNPMEPGPQAWKPPNNLHYQSSRKERWKAFTESTTFHGVRYIFGNAPFSIRR